MNIGRTQWGVGEAGNGKYTHTHTHTHTKCPSFYTGWMEPRARMGRNLDTRKRGSTLIKLVGYEHRVDALGGSGSKQWQTHTHAVSP